jgi:hypothetical protein
MLKLNLLRRDSGIFVYEQTFLILSVAGVEIQIAL